MNKLAKLDKLYVWHPFTQMKDWLQSEPTVIVKGRGIYLYDFYGKRYIDANSSIWTNLHGHNNSYLNRALCNQLKKIAHSSALGLANEPASILAERLVKIVNPRKILNENLRNKPLEKVFYSDNGSTAMEIAIKLAFEYTRRSGLSKNPRFLSLSSAYHGDTIGAVSVGHIDLFHKTWSPLLFKTDYVMSPYCYRCKYNKSEPERADAREYKKCRWECVDVFEKKFRDAKQNGKPITAFVFEPLIQGSAGMIAHPDGWLRKVAEIARNNRALLIADEVMTGFGRTGICKDSDDTSLFACHKEAVQPDFIALSKGLTGGYLPMAATLTTKDVFNAFLGDYTEFKTFFHGHSYTANQLGSSVALANLDLLEDKDSIKSRNKLELALSNELKLLWKYKQIGDIRQVGLVVGIELVKNWRTREPYEPKEQAGIKVCKAMAKRGVITRPVGNIVVIMPPYCANEKHCKKIVSAIAESIDETLN